MYTFDIETAIATWRQILKQNRVFNQDDLIELESHLRDRVDSLLADGEDEEKAFRSALSELGTFPDLESEFRKVRFGPSKRRRNVRSELIWNGYMLKNYWKTFSRNLIKNRGISFINILSLAVGLASFAFIAIYVTHESGYDVFHGGSDRLYRINKVVTTSSGATERHALTAGLLGPAIAEAFPEVEQVVRLQPWFGDVLLVHEGQSALTPDVVIADSNFFNVFGFELLRGDPDAVLLAPMSIVLTDTTANRLFGDLDPIGQIVKGINNLDYVVTGIAADPRLDSHLRFNALVSWSSTIPGGGGLELDFLYRWITQAPFTYVRLAPNTSASAFESKLPEFYAVRDPERAARYELFLQPVEDIYLSSADLMHTGNTRRGNGAYISTFSIIAILILAIAGINFVNLSTARGAERAKEVGVRKVFGAYRSQIGRQFLTESIFYSFLALVLAFAFVQMLLPSFVNFTGLNISTNVGAQSGLPWLLFGVALVLGLLSGAFPAAILSRLRPVRALRGTASGKGSVMLRNIFVVFQFAISMILVAASIIVLRQLEFVQSKDLGFALEQQVIINTDDTAIQEQFEAFRQAVMDHPDILSAAGSNAVPGASMMTTSVVPDGVPNDETYIANIVRVDDFSLLNTYVFEMAEGRFFNEDRPTDATNGIVINEMLARTLGWKDPVGRRLDISGELNEGLVIGVVKDFHFKSLHFAIEPLAFYVAPRGAAITVRLKSGNPQEALAHLEATWKRFESNWPFSYEFLDESFARFYTLERKLMTLLTVFAGLAIIIACMGLYGIASYITIQRTKEIGLRKALGASASQIVQLFIREFAKLIVVAITLAVPVVYIGAREWLQNFAYRVFPGMDVYLFAGGIVAVIALLSVSYRPIKAALAPPVQALRYE